MEKKWFALLLVCNFLFANGQNGFVMTANSVNRGITGMKDGIFIGSWQKNYFVMDSTGKYLFDGSFSYLDYFSKNLLIVANASKKYGLTDLTGKEVIPFIYNRISSPNEGLSLVSKDGKYGYMNEKGEIVIPLNYEAGGYCKEGLIKVKQNGKVGFIDKTGKQIIPFQYDDAGSYKFGLNYVELGNKIDVVNKNGKVIISGSTKYPEILGSKLIYQEPKLYTYDPKTETTTEAATVVNFKLASEHSFSGTVNGKFGLYDSLMNLITESSDYYFANENEGMYRIKKGEKYGFMNAKGEVMVQPQYDEATNFYNGLAAVKKEGIWGYIDKKGALAIPFQFSWAKEFSGGKYTQVNYKGQRAIIRSKTPAELKKEQALISQKKWPDADSCFAMAKEWLVKEKEGEAIAAEKQRVQKSLDNIQSFYKAASLGLANMLDCFDYLTRCSGDDAKGPNNTTNSKSLEYSKKARDAYTEGIANFKSAKEYLNKTEDIFYSSCPTYWNHFYKARDKSSYALTDILFDETSMKGFLERATLSYTGRPNDYGPWIGAVKDAFKHYGYIAVRAQELSDLTKRIIEFEENCGKEFKGGK